jgi:hypothetical protein
MKHLLLPSICALLVAGCNPAARQATAGTESQAAAPTTNTAPPATPLAAPLPPTGASNPAQTALASPTNPPVAAPRPATPAAAVLAAPKPPPELPAPAHDAVRLAQTTIDTSVVVSYIESIREPFSLNADQIIYLSDLGLGTPVINALLKKANNPLMVAGPVQQVVINAAPEPTNTFANAPVEAAATATNVLLTNYLASTVAGAPIGIPGAPQPASPAPVYGQPQPGYAPAPAPTQPPQPPAQQVVVTQPVTYNVFYESLSPYGNWVMIEPYGWCWQPSVVSVSPTWRPYCDGGQWLWTDNGWYWQSSYSWGWAPFHYGRWHRSSSIGWVWAPGTDWGPAWVSWRYNDAHCGWAPLPPECHWSAGVGFSWHSRGSRVSIGFGIWDDCWYATSWNRFCDPGLPRWCVDRRDIPRFVHNSRHAIGGDNSVNIVGNNNTVIINNGIPADEVQRRGRQEVRKYAVADASTPDRAAQRVNAASSSARPEVAAFRPRVQAEPGANSAPPPSILARQESRKNSNVPSTSSGFVPSRPGGASANPVPPVLGATAPGRSSPAATAPARPDSSLPSRSMGKAGEPASRSSGTAGMNPTPNVPSAPSLPTARPGNSPAPQANPSLPARSTPSIRSDLNNVPSTAPGNTAPRPNINPAPTRSVSTPTPAAPAARPTENSLARPTYANPSYSSPAARPAPTPAATPAPSPSSGIPARSNPGASTAVRQDTAALQQTPSIRSEFRKPEPTFRQSQTPSVGSSYNSSPSASSGDGYSAPARSNPSFQSQPSQRYSPPAPSPAPSPSPAVRSAPSPSPSYSAPARSYPAAPAQGGGSRPTPSRGSSPND